MRILVELVPDLRLRSPSIVPTDRNIVEERKVEFRPQPPSFLMPLVLHYMNGRTEYHHPSPGVLT